jgi:hypothetical protein
MLNFLLIFSKCDVLHTFVFEGQVDPPYQGQRIIPSLENPSSDYYATLFSNTPYSTYGSGYPLSNALNDDRSKTWVTDESSSNLPSSTHPVTFEITFPNKGHKINMIVLSCENNSNSYKGFPLDFKVYAKTEEQFNSEAEATLIYTGNFEASQRTVNQFVLFIPTNTYSYFKLQFNQNYNNKAAALSTLQFYYDTDYPHLVDLFTDDTWSYLKMTRKETKQFILSLNNRTDGLKDHFTHTIKVAKQIIQKKLPGVLFSVKLVGPDPEGSWNFLQAVPSHYYVQANEEIEIYMSKSHGIDSVTMYIIGNREFSTDVQYSINLSPGYQKFTINSNLNSLDHIKVGVLAFGYKRSDLSVTGDPPLIRLIGGTRYPLYRYKEDQSEFETYLSTYLTQTTCDITTFNEKQTDIKYNIAGVVGNEVFWLTTATGLNEAIKINKDNSKTLNDVIEIWDYMISKFWRYAGYDYNSGYKQRSKWANYLTVTGSGVAAYALGKRTTWYNLGNFDATQCYDTSYTNYPYSISNLLYSQVIDHSSGWVFYHEWGHNMDPSLIEQTEATNNLFALFMGRVFDCKYVNRINEQGQYQYMSKTYLKTNTKIPSSNTIWQILTLYHMTEIYGNVNTTYPKMLKELRANPTLYTSTISKSTDYGLNDRWVYLATKVTKINFFPLWAAYGQKFEENQEAIQALLASDEFIQPPSTIKYITDRYYLNFDPIQNDVRGVNVNPYAYPVFSQVYIMDNTAELRLDLANVTTSSNEVIEGAWSEILGYEYLDLNDANDHKSILYDSTFTMTLGETIDYLITPISLNLQRYPPFKLHCSLDLDKITFASKSNWNLELYPETTKATDTRFPLNNLKDDVTTTCFRTDADQNPGRKGFIIDFGEAIEMIGFMYLQDFPSLNKKEHNIIYEYSVDKETWTEWKSKNGTMAHYRDYEYASQKKKKYQIFSHSVSARYLRVTTDFEAIGLCDIQIIVPNNDMFYQFTLNVEDEDYTNDLGKYYRHEAFPAPSEDDPVFVYDNTYDNNYFDENLNDNDNEEALTFDDEEEEKEEENNTSKPKSKSTIIIVAAVVAVVVFVVIVVVVIILLRKKKMRQHNDGDIVDF